MESKTRPVRIRFKDPDNLSVLFETRDWLNARIVGWLASPRGADWVIELMEPLECHDADGRTWRGKTFLLHPNGLEAEEVMKSDFREVQPNTQLTTTVMILTEGCLPSRIESYSEYGRYPVISGALVFFPE